MGKLSSSVANTRAKPNMLMFAEHMIKVSPETVLLLALLCSYMLWAHPLIALLVVLVVLMFMVRMGALFLARAALDRGRLQESGALLRVALLLNPYSPDALALAGVLALMRGSPSLAEIRLRQAIGCMPGRPAFYAALSGALLEQGQAERAAQAAQEALHLDPRCAAAHLHLAEAERLRGAPAHTIEDRLRAGLAASPPPAAEALMRCVLASHLLSEQRVAEATLTLHGVEALLPRCSLPAQRMLNCRLGELMIAQGEIERAQEYLQHGDPRQAQGNAAVWRVAQL